MNAHATTLDIASGPDGGAARFVVELDRYLSQSQQQDLQVIGRNRHLTPAWMIQRELLARGTARRIAINSASFRGGSNKTVLLRNALHFADEQEINRLGMPVSKKLWAKSHAVRSLAGKAEHIVVPCSSMAERVTAMLPHVADRISVQFHPVTMPIQRVTSRSKSILVPIINAPYKQLTKHFEMLSKALDMLNREDVTITTTTISSDFPRTVTRDNRFEFIGVVRAAELQKHWGAASAIYFPPSFESFGYALAEARCLGVPAIAPGSPQNHEIAGASLSPYRQGSVASLAEAVSQAFALTPPPDPDPFDAIHYFDTLLRVAPRE